MSETVDPTAMFEEVLQNLADLPATMTLPLDPPIEFNGGQYSSLTLREPTADEARKAEEQLRSNPMLPHNRRNRQIHLVSLVSGVPVPVIQKLGVSKLQTAMVYLNLFLDVGHGTGAT